MRIFLLPFSLFYLLIVRLRNWFFDKGFLKKKKVSVPVISIGNISAGGVGKTPIVEMLIEKLTHRRKTAIVSRGYGRKSKGTQIVSNGKGNFAAMELSGDEPSQLAKKFPGIIVVADENRPRGAQKAIDLGAHIVVLDDGFQHRFLARDIDIVVVSANEILDGDFLLPAGNRREPLSSLRRADCIIVSRCSNEIVFQNAAERIKYFHKPMAGVKSTLKAVKEFKSRHTIGHHALANKRVVLFSGIGNPDSFEKTAQALQITMCSHLRFGDHHWYTKNDLQKIEKTMGHYNADLALTTEKDSVRLENYVHESLFMRFPVYFIEIRQLFIAGESVFDELIKPFVNV